MAKKEFEVGMFYLKNNAPSPAIKRFSVLIENYQGTSIIPQTLYRMYEAFLMLNLETNANKTATLLKYNFPKSKWTKEIKNHSTTESTEDSIFDNIINKITSIF